MSSASPSIATDPRARFISGPMGPHVLEMVLTGWASMLAVFAVEFLSLLYLGTLKDEAVLGAVGAPGAREDIRGFLSGAGLREPEDFFFAA